MNRVEKVDDIVPVRSALISVSDKSELSELVQGLAKTCPGITLYSTGGTYQRIESIIESQQLTETVTLVPITEYTGQSEMQGGLVKTLDFSIYLGLLAESYNEAHRQDLQRTGAHFFDLTVVNLYPFQQAVAATDTDLEDARANIDIGGPTMLRASAKNFLRVAAVCSPNTYADFISHLSQNNGATTLRYRFELARDAFLHTAEYDTAIAEYLNTTELTAEVYRHRDKGE